MMWAATVRRGPTGHARHHSQFGARLQLARALTHAPYLICDGVYNCSPPTNTDLDQDLSSRYGIAYSDSQGPEIQNGDIIVDLNSSVMRTPYQNHLWSSETHQDPRIPQEIYVTERRMSEPPCFSYNLSSESRRNTPSEREPVRVQLPYSRREADADEVYPVGEHIIRRYDDFSRRGEPEDEGPVGLSYQQRSLGGPYNGGEVWGTDPSIDCWGDRPLLLKTGRTREIFRTLFVVALSLTLVTFVVMGFAVYNMLITTLFLFFLLSTVSLLIFLLMRKPSCFSCCSDAFDLPNSTEEELPVDQQQQQQQRSLGSFLSEPRGNIVIKRRLTDSPPPYESPPDYHSLPPEVLVSARNLSGGVETPQDSLIVRVHGDQSGKTTPKANPKRSLIRNFSPRSSSSAAPLLPSSGRKASPPESPSGRRSGKLLGLTPLGNRRSAENSPPNQDPTSSPSPPPPPYECIVISSEVDKDEKGC